MKRIHFFVALMVALSAVIMFSNQGVAMCSLGCPRDAVWLNQSYEAQCHFPPILNPCAVPCRPPLLQKQAVPCAYKTACPSITLPAYGVAYGENPYPLFGMR